jgi:hypothetical protein
MAYKDKAKQAEYIHKWYLRNIEKRTAYRSSYEESHKDHLREVRRIATYNWRKRQKKDFACIFLLLVVSKQQAVTECPASSKG